MAEVNSKPRGRRPKYDWNGKRDVCYKLYIEEKRPIREVIAYFSDALGLDQSQIPSARDFHRQFARWNFPQRRKKLPVDDEEQLIERVKQLWAANYVQKQMLDELQDEGWELDELSLGRFRRKHGIVMRVANGFNRDNMGPGTGKKRKRGLNADEGGDSIIMDTSLPQGNGNDVVESDLFTNATQNTQANAPPEEAARRAQRMLELQAQSDIQLQAKKRRRRIRGLAHLPPDEPGLPPRYKSETSLDECKAFLQLSNEAYREVRQRFEEICNENNVIKKTECAPGEWQNVKDQLVRDNIHLSAMLNPLHTNLNERQNALEVICSDVTKRMRTLSKRILLKDANNILGLNPEQSKELRRQFYEILKADNFQTMLLCGKEHWEELRQRWVDSSPEAQQLHAQGLDETKKKCVGVLLRDAMKRHNDNHVSKIPHMVRAGNVSYGPGPGPARRSKGTSQPKNASPTTTQDQMQNVPTQTFSTRNNANVDPALYASHAASATPMHVGVPPQSTGMPQPSQTVGAPLSAYFRLSPDSRLSSTHPKLWLATLPARTIADLRSAATSKAVHGWVRKIFGVVKNSDGREDRYQIDGDDEFDAYLETIADTADGKAIFLAVLDTQSASPGLQSEAL